jgi:O-antigen/teichoic acid export membrane protein
VWVVLGYGGSQTLRLVGNLILTRLLFEEAFGLMALMSAVLLGIELFSDIGIRPSIIQNERDDDSFVNTAWTMQVGRGVAIWLVACAAAVPVSRLYEEPQLAWLLPIVSLTALIAGFNSTKFFTLNRQLDVARMEITLVVAQAAGLVTMLSWALVSRSVLALVAGALATSLTRMVMTHAFLPGIRNRLTWERAAASDLFRFGRWVFLSTLLTFVAQQADRLVFGLMVPLDLLGVYYIGTVIATLPSAILGRLSSDIIFPVYSSVRDQDGGLGRLFERTRLPLVVLAGWAFSGLVAGGPSAVELLYDPRYQMAGWVVQLLGIGGFALVLCNTYASALLASGRPKWISFGQLAKVVAMAALIPAGFHAGEVWREGAGFPGAVLAYSLAEFVRYAVTAAYGRQLGLTGLAQDLRIGGMVAVVGGLGAFGASAMGDAGVHVVLRCIIIAALVTLAWAPLGWPLLAQQLEARRTRG